MAQELTTVSAAYSPKHPICCPFCADTRVSIVSIAMFDEQPNGSANFYKIDQLLGVVATEIPAEPDHVKGRCVVLEMRGSNCGHAFNMVFMTPNPAVGGTTYFETSQVMVPMPSRSHGVDIGDKGAIWAQLVSSVALHAPLVLQWLVAAKPSWEHRGAQPVLVLRYPAHLSTVATAIALPENISTLESFLRMIKPYSSIAVILDEKPVG